MTSTTASPLSTADVLEYLADGWTSSQIADEWGVVPHTVVNRINVLKKRYSAVTHAQVVARAIKAGDLDIGPINAYSHIA